MTEIRFYHLTRKDVTDALPEIVAKALSRGHRVLVKAQDADRLPRLSEALWSHDPLSFLPHGQDGQAFDQAHLVWLTVTNDNPNAADVLVLVDGVEAPAGTFSLCCDIFDGNDDIAVVTAREKWKMHKAAGCDLAYFQQDDNGKWAKKQ